MKKFYKLLVFVFVVSGAVLIFSGRAEAQTVYTGATASPTTARTLCTTLDPVDFAAVVSNVRFNVTTGVITYDIGLGWRSCTGGADTRAYAIYGPPEICPVSGTYGASGTVTDCVKYIGNPAYQGDGNGLQCGALRDAACLTGDGWSIIRAEQGPGGGLEPIPNMTYQIPNWNTVRLADGSGGISNLQMCQFYKVGPNFGTQIGDRRCIPISVSVSWEFQPPANSGECEASMRGSSPVAPGETRLVDYTVRNTGGNIWGVSPANATEYHRLRNSSAAPWTQSPVPPNEIDIDGTGVEDTFGGIIRPGGATSWGVNMTIPSNLPEGTYRFDWRIWGQGNNESAPRYISPVCPLIIDVERPVEKPYFRVYGGDVIAGRQFTDAGACNPSKVSDAKIRAFSESSGANRVGAGGQFAVSAASTIEGFMSNNLHSNRPTKLSFGNYATAPLTMTTSGKDETGYTGCVGNLYQISLNINGGGGFLNPPSTQNAVTFNDADNMKFRHNSGMSFEGNVIYDGTWSDFDDVKIPIYLVQGNIDISPDVERLDGLYFATGTVNTCAGSIAECKDRKLTINGAVIADKIELARLLGDVDAAGANEGPSAANIAEVINFAPEVYLALSQLMPGDDIILNGNYDSVVGLPPVL